MVLRFQVTLLMTHAGRILSAALTPANFQDHDAATTLGYATAGGILLGDLGSRAAANAELVAEETGRASSP